MIKTPYREGPDGGFQANRFLLHHGGKHAEIGADRNYRWLPFCRRYRADIRLRAFQAFAPNATVAEKIRSVGFVDVTISGSLFIAAYTHPD
jgi:hypothetical protein